MTLVKGNIVVTDHGKHGIVLAVRKDGTRANVYVYGPDREDWMPVEWLTVEVAGLETCYKCGGSGLYYYGGPVVNGVYQGKTGDCYGCSAKGKQDDDDRKRCHYYWHRKVEAGDDIESPMERSPMPEEAAPKAEKPKRPKIRSKVKATASPAASDSDDGSRLIDCKGCGTLHRDDTLCPW